MFKSISFPGGAINSAHFYFLGVSFPPVCQSRRSVARCAMLIGETVRRSR